MRRYVKINVSVKSRQHAGWKQVYVCLRAKREIQPGEFIRYQYTDQSEHLKKIFECECCFHVGLCQPHGKKSMLERLAAALKQSFPATRAPKVGTLVIVKTGGVAQQWRVSNIKIATGTLVTIKFENSETIVDKSWFMFDANSGSLFLQRLGFFGDMALKRTTNSYEVRGNILNLEKMMDGKALMVYMDNSWVLWWKKTRPTGVTKQDVAGWQVFLAVLV